MRKVKKTYGAWLCSAVLLSGGTFAADAGTACNADRLEATGAYAACRLDADAKSLETGRAAVYTQCDNRLAKDLVIAERKSRGTCLAAADFQSIQTLVADYTGNMADVVVPSDDGCPPEYADRTPDEILNDLWSAVYKEWDDETEAMAAIACNFHENAFVISDQGITIGRDGIAQSLRSLASLFDYAAPELMQEDWFRNTMRVSYSLDGGWIVMPDGVDTYVFEAGKIRKAVQHGLIEFTGPPPIVD